jgi:aspartate kinase
MIEILKFGGASIKNTDSIKSVVKILKTYDNENIVIVFSAIANVTNLLEELVELYTEKSSKVSSKVNEIKKLHFDILKDLFNKNHQVYNTVNNLFIEIDWALEEEPNLEFSYDYDQIVSVGELLSSNIMSAYLKECGFSNIFLDIRDVLKTDNSHQNANIDWQLTEKCANDNISSFPSVTQGFIGCTSENFTTTLGREGSDFSAAILASVLNANKVVIWKDVDGVLNADPRYFNETQVIPRLSFTEAVELAFYGAKVIHPKTIQPLQNKMIPLHVRSFINTNKVGTVIDNSENINNLASFIVKKNQILLSISDKNLSFIVEEHLGYIFSLFSKNNIVVNLMQNSAVSLSLCVDNNRYNLSRSIDELSKKFDVLYNNDVMLYTIRNYNEQVISSFVKDKNILLEQKSRNTIQFIVA